MRRLADRLGVTAASLYWHVRDKDELLALLADAISAQMPEPSLSPPWREELTRLAHAVRRVALTHRDAARVLAATPPLGPQRLQRLEALFAVLRHAGFAPADIVDASYLLNIYVMGFVLDEVLGPRLGEATQAESMRTDVEKEPTAAPEGHLVLEHGALNATICAGTVLHGLYHLTYEGRPPTVAAARDGTVRLRQRRGRATSCVVALNDAIPWDVTIAGGAVHVLVDSVRLRLRSLRINGSSSEVTLRLPTPTGTVPLHIRGSVQKLLIERPYTAALRVHVQRSSSHLVLDDLQLSWAGGGTDWESPSYAAAADRYDLEIHGSADAVTVSRRDEAATQGGDHTSQTIQAQVRSWFASLSREAYPNLVMLADELARPDQARRFHVGLQILLDGLERRLEASKRT
jgi:TetR/AcrR family tetracycline transcriptional repressor